MAERIFDKSTGLLIVDMLNDFIRPDGVLPVPNGEALIPAVARARRAATEAGSTVFYLCDAHREDDPEFRAWPPHAVAGTPGAQVVQELAPAEEDVVIPGRHFSKFFATGLDVHLRERGITRVVLCGVYTDICVYHTAADACQLTYEVVIAKNAVAAVTEEQHSFALRQMERLFKAKLVEL